MLQKPVRKPVLLQGCETCLFKDGDFTKDTVDPNIIRCYCKARHFLVDAESMSKNCDFFKANIAFVKPQENNKYGL